MMPSACACVVHMRMPSQYKYYTGKPCALQKELEKAIGVPCLDHVTRGGKHYTYVFDGVMLINPPLKPARG